jgi:preprotein translocase subunit SecF
MEFFRIRRDIPFMRHALVLNVISFVTFAAAVFFLVHARAAPVDRVHRRHGAGGRVRSRRPTCRRSAIVEALNLGEVQVQNFGTSRDVMIRLPVRRHEAGSTWRHVCSPRCARPKGQVRHQAVHDAAGRAVSRPACAASGAEPLKLKRTEFVGPSVGEELATDGALALGMTVIGIMIYLAFRFEWKFSVAGIVANLHDVVIILGFFAFFQWEFSLAVLAAILAVLGYSVNESVVIFDRIRETFRKIRKLTRRRSSTTPSPAPSAAPSSPTARRR